MTSFRLRILDGVAACLPRPLVARTYVRRRNWLRDDLSLPPSLATLHEVAQFTALDPVEAMCRLFSHVGHADAAELAAECTPFIGELAARSTAGDELRPRFFRMDVSSAVMLYLLVRLARPHHIVETGVADGLSSAVILEAIRRNGEGQLTSFEVSSDVGQLVDVNREDWRLIVLNGASIAEKQSDFQTKLRNLGPVDFFLHDSDHSYAWHAMELAEFVAARPRYVCSDDIDASHAWVDCVMARGLKPVHLVQERKVFGAAAINDVGAEE